MNYSLIFAIIFTVFLAVLFFNLFKHKSTEQKLLILNNGRIAYLFVAGAAFFMIIAIINIGDKKVILEAWLRISISLGLAIVSGMKRAFTTEGLEEYIFKSRSYEKVEWSAIKEWSIYKKKETSTSAIIKFKYQYKNKVKEDKVAISADMMEEAEKIFRQYANSNENSNS